MKYEKGTKIYYTGDGANISGNFEIIDCNKVGYILKELAGEGRLFKGIWEVMISDKFDEGRGRRFITQKAVDEFYSAHNAWLIKE